MMYLNFFILMMTTNAFAIEQSSLAKYYNNVYLGEKKTLNYTGPSDPRTRFESSIAKEEFLDDYYNINHLNSSIQYEAFELHHFWYNKILDKSTCPDEELGENYDYIRYLFRLISMSYLFESIKVNHQIASELNLPKNSCNLSYKELFSKCTPQTDDMKKFKERVYGKFVNEFEKIRYSSYNNKEIESWMELFHLSTESNLDPTFSRLHFWCNEKGIDCKKLKVTELTDGINLFCERDKRLITQLCEEKDQLYGLSYAPTIEELVRLSNAFNLINTRGMGEDCLRRFVKINSSKEILYPQLSRQFLSVYKYLQKDNSRYLQGALFLPGALKEFDMKGLSDFLSALKPPVVSKVVIAKAKPPEIKKVVKKIEAKEVVIAKEVPVVAEVIEVLPSKISEFEKSVENLNTLNVNHVTIDMDKFRDDFEFTSKMISSLSIPLKKFQTRAALKDMKDFDRFGEKDAPVGIVFLKFLIDTDNHQGLYNVISVLGERFYISNDFEHKTKNVYAEIRNDATTKNRWQITLLKYEPPKK